MHRPHANPHRNTATCQPDACSDALASGNARSHIQRGIGGKNGNNKGDDYEDLVVLANQHGLFTRCETLSKSGWKGHRHYHRQEMTKSDLNPCFY
ncbi:Uncharacterised protein [Enterobacter cloacae]|nr:Uncharacterised protein [Enterobacter cloacae]